MNGSEPQQTDYAAILNLARRRRAEQLFTLLGRTPLWHRLARLMAPDVLIWLTIVAESLFWVAWIGRDGGHGLTMMIAISVASLLSSIAGFAFSAICGAILFHFDDDTVRIVQIMIVCSIANQAAMTWSGRHAIDWRGLRVYLAGGAPGLAIGVWILLNIDRTLYTHMFGAFLLTYGSYMLVRNPTVVLRQPYWADALAGFLGGITGGAAGFPGAFVTIWCGMKGWDKARQRAVFQPFILIMQIAALLTISLARRPAGGNAGFDFLNLLFIPASLVGTMLGLMLYRRLTDRQFGWAVNVLLVVSGLGYVAR
jgi:uncharacterized membrane protein YfcA